MTKHCNFTLKVKQTSIKLIKSCRNQKILQPMDLEECFVLVLTLAKLLLRTTTRKNIDNSRTSLLNL